MWLKCCPQLHRFMWLHRCSSFSLGQHQRTLFWRLVFSFCISDFFVPGPPELGRTMANDEFDPPFELQVTAMYESSCFPVNYTMIFSIEIGLQHRPMRLNSLQSWASSTLPSVGKFLEHSLARPPIIRGTIACYRMAMKWLKNVLVQCQSMNSSTSVCLPLPASIYQKRTRQNSNL